MHQRNCFSKHSIQQSLATVTSFTHPVPRRYITTFSPQQKRKTRSSIAPLISSKRFPPPPPRAHYTEYIESKNKIPRHRPSYTSSNYPGGISRTRAETWHLIPTAYARVTVTQARSDTTVKFEHTRRPFKSLFASVLFSGKRVMPWSRERE